MQLQARQGDWVELGVRGLEETCRLLTYLTFSDTS